VPKARRPSAQTVSVLQAFASQPAVWRYGYELGLEVGLKTGSLYPILMRLSDRGLLESSWERDPQAGRPPRHLCRLTGAGEVVAAQLVSEPAARRTRPEPRGVVTGLVLVAHPLTLPIGPATRTLAARRRARSGIMHSCRECLRVR
jgi:PadR family transcriptional regulator, regulatory protein PadR